MEEKSGNKPLRTSSNTAKDIQDTYLKNEGKRPGKNIDFDNSEEKDMEEKIEETMESNDEIVNETVPEENDAAEELVKQLNALENEKAELKDQLVRRAAEFENLRKRSIKEKQDLLEFGNEKLLFKMLELLDDINNAVLAGEKTTDFESLLTGLQMIKNKADKLFNDSGVKQMEDPTGEEFNVDFHEAMMHVPNEDVPEGHIVQVIQHGYMLGEKVLRHAKVITSAGPANS